MKWSPHHADGFMEECQRLVEQGSSDLVAAPRGKDRMIELGLLLLQFRGDRAAGMISDPSDRHGLRRNAPYDRQPSDEVLSHVLVRGELFEHMKFRLVDRGQLVHRQRHNGLPFTCQEIDK